MGAAYVFFRPVDESNVSAGDADLTLRGEASGDRSGWSVGGGDIDGDGLADIVVGALRNDSSGQDAGAAYVIYGDESLGGELSLSSVRQA